MSGVTFNKLPRVIEQARSAVPDPEIVGYLLCALERPPQMTGVLFCNHLGGFPEGLPIRTPAIVHRCTRAGYEVVTACGGGVYVVAHWLYQNGALDRFDRVH